MNESLYPYPNAIITIPQASEDTLPSSLLSEQTKQLEQQVTMLQEMITLLQSYEKQCIDKLDLKGAKETRNRITQLTVKEEEMREQIIAMAQDKQVMEMSQEQQDLIQCFDRVWSTYLNDLVSNLAQTQQQLKNQQKNKRKQLHDRFQNEKTNGFKPTTKLTNLRRKVVGLMKLHKYEQAEFESIKAKNTENQQRKNWEERTQERKRNALQLFTRRANKDFEVLRSKNQDILFQKMSERDSKFSILLKKNQVKRIQASRSTKQLMKSISVASLNTKRFQ